MRAVLAVATTLCIFVVMWVVVAVIIAVMAWAATAAGVQPGLFLLVNVFLIWIVSPGVGAGVAVFATSSHFESVDAKTIFVAFVSVCSIVLLALLCLSLLAYYFERSSLWHVLLLVAQAVAILLGARVGLALSPRALGVRADDA